MWLIESGSDQDSFIPPPFFCFWFNHAACISEGGKCYLYCCFVYWFVFVLPRLHGRGKQMCLIQTFFVQLVL